jgi:hypothetical protein
MQPGIASSSEAVIILLGSLQENRALQKSHREHEYSITADATQLHAAVAMGLKHDVDTHLGRTR